MTDYVRDQEQITTYRIDLKRRIVGLTFASLLHEEFQEYLILIHNTPIPAPNLSVSNLTGIRKYHTKAILYHQLAEGST